MTHLSEEAVLITGQIIKANEPPTLTHIKWNDFGWRMPLYHHFGFLASWAGHMRRYWEVARLKSQA